MQYWNKGKTCKHNHHKCNNKFCNKLNNKCFNKNCKCFNPNCKKYEEIANEKCQKACCLSKKANQVANEASESDRRAKCLKEKYNEEVNRAKDLWCEHKKLSDMSENLMDEAKECLNKAADCYENHYTNHCGCNMNYLECDQKNYCNCDCDNSVYKCICYKCNS